MRAARYTNRIGRTGRQNPGRRHLAGEDVTAAMQRQYLAILESLRARHEYESDAKRKQVAAATAREMHLSNPSLGDMLGHFGIGSSGAGGAQNLTEGFHGRPVRDVIDVEEREEYDEHGAILGYLIELEVLTPDGRHQIPINFAYDRAGMQPETVFLVGNAARNQILFIGGDQDIGDMWDGQEIVKPSEYLGPVWAISYFADKHHLEGPAAQKEGIEYRHKFGPRGEKRHEFRTYPHLIYDARNRKLHLIGGEYTIEDEGITG